MYCTSVKVRLPTHPPFHTCQFFGLARHAYTDEGGGLLKMVNVGIVSILRSVMDAVFHGQSSGLSDLRTVLLERWGEIRQRSRPLLGGEMIKFERRSLFEELEAALMRKARPHVQRMCAKLPEMGVRLFHVEADVPLAPFCEGVVQEMLLWALEPLEKRMRRAATSTASCGPSRDGAASADGDAGSADWGSAAEAPSLGALLFAPISTSATLGETTPHPILRVPPATVLAS